MGAGVTQPLVTAIIPVHDGEQFIRAAITSVLEQTYAPIECVVVDDGSTDDTPAIVASFGSDVRSIRQPNRGVAAARNIGISGARGELVAFLDADDLWLPDKTAVQVDEWVRHRPAMVYSGYRLVDENLRPRLDIFPSPFPRRLLGALLMEQYGFAFSITGMVDRRAMAAVGPFDERLSTSADLEYVWRVSQYGGVIGVGSALALYRLHAGAQMHRDLNAVEHDVRVILDEVFPASAAHLRNLRTRAEANLHTHLLARSLQHRALADAGRHAAAALRRSPTRVIALPLSAAMRRAVRAIAGRWPVSRPVTYRFLPPRA